MAPVQKNKKGGRGSGHMPSTSKGASSSNPDRVTDKKSNRSGGNLRDKQTINRLNLYKNSRVTRNKKGEVLGGDLANRDQSGGKDITGASGRIQPDRRWFGNTRTIGQGELDKFREEMRTVQENPYAVVLRRKKVPMGLLSTKDDGNDDDGGAGSAKARRADLLGQEPYDRAFAKGRSQKRPKLPAAVAAALGGGASGLEAIAASARQRYGDYEELWDGRGADARSTIAEAVDTSSRDEKRDELYTKGQSRRIWGELYKVLDCSDVVIHVLDARDPQGTTCTRLVEHMKTRASHKHLIFVLNKVDLVPNWVLRRWMRVLGKTAPTLAFRASVTKAYGKGALINVLRQYAVLHKDAQQISVGVVGFPNVGKSSVINALRAKAVCKAAPIPGETKIWQYVALTRRINLIDSPGVVYNDPRSERALGEDSDVNTVLRGVVRAEKLPDPAAFVLPMLKKAKPEHIAAAYGIDFAPPAQSDVQAFSDYADEFIKRLAIKMGRLIHGGEPDIRTVAVTMINAWQRGTIPHFVAPPRAEGEADRNAPEAGADDDAMDEDEVEGDDEEGGDDEEDDDDEAADEAADDADME
ncbi:P-loop containing nucleoside triphosphate hydrolase protein [Pelagophyceae sp. CCMP2097]|nr:P-loop containing nucleoside triphosphate hydrolase protein [Pelagophyceae sp. CCMP2097]